jgi:hypothetical protein
MKKVLLIALLLSSFSVFAEDCTIDSPDGCDGTMEILNAPENPTCDISDPECPMPEIAQRYSATHQPKLLTFGCFSFNRLSRRYGVGVAVARPVAALGAFQRCRLASGILGFACQRPICFQMFY